MLRQIIVMLILMSMVVVAQPVPEPQDISTLNKIGQEHQNTRKFFSDELTRQRTEFFKMFESRADYYEESANDIVSKAVWKLGLMWGGVVFLIFGISNFLGRRLDKRKWTKMLDSAKAELKAEITQEKTKFDTMRDAKANELTTREQKVDLKVNALKKARPQLVAMQQRMAQQQKELNDTMKNLGLFEDRKNG